MVIDHFVIRIVMGFEEAITATEHEHWGVGETSGNHELKDETSFVELNLACSIFA